MSPKVKEYFKFVALGVAAGAALIALDKTFLQDEGHSHDHNHQSVQTGVDEPTFTKEEAGALSQYFGLKTCLAVNYISMEAFSSLSKGFELDQAENMAKNTAACETENNMTVAQADQMLDALDKKYGADLGAVCQNSIPMLPKTTSNPCMN
ncbi:MAG: hypothetical protein CO093_08935 [Alphaproteobacteria bacterium CG_4_9_14_3_um_filter_47_13]|nr:MAG: hypothetical protein CO093_08935 [Alphaproteobacteria bacterium CG_4_9_14_3_um_filter_47_13]